MTDTSTAKNNILLFFLGPIITILLYIICCVVLDPFGLFHNNGINIGHLRNMRLQAAGALNTTAYNSLIIGSSVFENASATELSNLLKTSAINISISGSTFFERKFILEKALNKKKQNKTIEHIVYSLDSVYTTAQQDATNYPAKRFSYLYNNILTDNIKTYFDFAVILCPLKNQLGSNCLHHDNRYDHPNEWASDPENAARFGGFDHWLKAAGNHQIIDSLKTIAIDAQRITNGQKEKHTQEEINNAIKKSQNYIDENILALARNNPQTQFHLVFPPYARLLYAKWYQLNMIEWYVHQAVIQTLAQQTKDVKNLHVYGYEDMDFLDDIANYKDTVHFSQHYNSVIHKSIAEGAHRLTPDTVKRYLKTAQQKAANYNFQPLIKAMETHGIKTASPRPE